jgi:hypothetical protein
MGILPEILGSKQSASVGYLQRLTVMISPQQ